MVCYKDACGENGRRREGEEDEVNGKENVASSMLEESCLMM